MPIWLSPEEHAKLASAADRLMPPRDAHPGGAALGVADYIDMLLGAFTFDPPRIFAGGPFSGRAGGEARFDRFLPLSRMEELAWRTRIEGSQGIPEREPNGPTKGWQSEYRDGLAALGDDFSTLAPDQQDERLAADRDFELLVYRHACEGAYGAPEYGGNPSGRAWEAIQFPGDVQPRGYTDQEVAGRE